MEYGHWDVSAVGVFDPTDWFGFIYVIEHRDTGRAYIGKKFFQHKRQKTKLNRSRLKESDWRNYQGSSEHVKALIAEHGVDAFDFRITKLCSGRCELSYSEEEAQFAADVLRARLPNGERKYLNRTIAYKNFSGIEKQTEASKVKLSESLKRWNEQHPNANVCKDDTREKISNTLKVMYASNPEYGDAISRSIREKRSPAERSAAAKYARSFQDNTACAKGGAVSGAKLRDSAQGIFKLSKDEKHIIAQSGGRAAGTLPWWTDGTHTKRSITCPGPEWRRGRLPRSLETRKKISTSMRQG